MSDSEDRVLVARCLDGDPDAFGVLVDRYYRLLYNVSLRMAGSPDDAADITQTVFLKAFEKLSTFDPQYKFFSWIYRITMNETLNLLQRRRPAESVEEGLVITWRTPEDEWAREQLAEQVQRALMELSINSRQVIVLRHFANLTYRDMSVVLGVPEKTVKSRLFTARRLLEDVLVRMRVALA
jgi:RNA polymerase sigma-70 factor (ECF subfamily)